MTRSLLATLIIAGAVSGVVGLAPTGAGATDSSVTAPQFRVDCWIGMKFGDRPGQLIRGWICERPYRPVDADRQAATSGPEPRSGGKEDVAEIGSGGDRR